MAATRILAFLRKTFRENLREWKVLILALAFAPAFVFMMKGYFGAASPAYNLLVVNRDGAGPAATALVEQWRQARHPDGKAVFAVALAPDVEGARGRLVTREAELLVEIPAGFSRALDDFRDGRRTEAPRLVVHSDEGNLRGAMAMALSDYLAFGFAAAWTGARMPLDVTLQPVGSSRPRTEFDLYVPALLVLAIIMVLFTAATSLIKEVDKKTMSRLMMSRLRTWEMMTALSINQVLIGVAALALAYGAALACGYRGEGSVLALLAIGAVTTLSVVAMAVLTSAFLSSMFELLTVGTFPFFVLMFFSECMFPLPRIPLLPLGGHILYANDVLPTSLGVKAFTRVLNHGARLGDVTFELGAILVLTVVYFAVGVRLFRRRHMRI